jgi:hypothetical protein
MSSDVIPNKVLTSEPFFIVGAPRSGSTLLRNILRACPGLEAPEETFFYRWSEPFGSPRYDNFYRCDPVIRGHRLLDGFSDDEFWGIYAAAQSRRELQDAYMASFLRKRKQPTARWFDKTPQNVFGVFRLLGDYPESKILHIYRNPLDVVASIMSGRGVGPLPFRAALTLWHESVSLGQYAQTLVPSRVKSICFEQLTVEPQRLFESLLQFIDYPAMALPREVRVHPAPVRFSEVLSDEQVDEILLRSRVLIEKLGYPTDRAAYEQMANGDRMAMLRGSIEKPGHPSRSSTLSSNFE